MTDERSQALVTEGARALAVTRRLAERTLAERVERREQVFSPSPIDPALRVIDVFPVGPNALQDALDRAHQKSTLRLHAGSYWASEPLVKDVRIEAAPSARPVITCDRWVIAGVLELTGVLLRPATEDDDCGPALRVEGEARLDNLEADDEGQIYAADGGRLTITHLRGGRVSSVGPGASTRISDARVHELTCGEEGWLEATDVQLADGAFASGGGTMRLHRVDIREGPGRRDEALEFMAHEGADLLVDDVTTRSGVSVQASGEGTRIVVRRLRCGGIVRTGREGLVVEAIRGSEVAIHDAWFVAGLARRDSESAITVADTHEGLFELDTPSGTTRLAPEERKRLVMNRLRGLDEGFRAVGRISPARWQVDLLDGKVVGDLWPNGQRPGLK